jgi:hypothetical protein
MHQNTKIRFIICQTGGQQMAVLVKASTGLDMEANQLCNLPNYTL